MSEGPDFSRKGQRKVTPFVGQELLYDYVCGGLDPERIEALEKLLSENRDLRGELEKVRAGLAYAVELSRTSVSPQLVESVRTPSTYLHVLLTKTRFTDWSDGVKLALEGFVIAVGALALIVVIPWGKILSLRSYFDKTSVVLTEVTKTKSEDQDGAGAPATKETKFTFEDEDKPADKTKKETKVAVQATPVPAPGPKAAAAPEAKVPAPAAKAPVPTPAPIAEKGIAAPAPDSGKKQGFLYRGTIKVTNVADVTAKLVSFIDSIGGRKAGEVELGWRKGSGSYFHFTIPEAKYVALMQEFNAYGTLKVQKEPHPRVMPDGIVRLIITVDEKASP